MSQAPFQRNAQVDKPGIIGARWWHAALADQGAQMVRRDAIRNILIVGGVLAGLGTMLAFCGYAASSSSGSSIPDDAQEQRKTALEMQKAYGWSFGAVGETLVFDGTSTTPFDKAALATIAADLQPSRSDLLPFYVRTLFEAGYATPAQINTLAPEETAAGFQPLANVMQPLHTAAMDSAYGRGKSLASVFAALADAGGSANDAKAGVVVDLSGPEAVAFAAGAADVFDPVFLFDNWPHPRGVVRSHETLAAAAYYQPLFAKARTTTTKKPPLFVIDRRRLSSYTDDATQFDNRYVAKLPVPASALKSLGVDRLLYVVPTTAETTSESDDLNEEFVLYQQSGIEVRPVAADQFVSGGTDAGIGVPPGGKPNNTSDKQLADGGYYYYGGSPASHHAFFAVHPWIARPPRVATVRPSTTSAASYKPSPRTTPYSTTSPTTSTTTRPRPTNFGTVPVLVAAGTGVVLGARYSRSGSWNRSSGGSWTG